MQLFITASSKSHKTKSVLLCTISLLMITGCHQTKSEEVYKTKVDYPRAPDLEVGVSISRSLAVAQAKQQAGVRDQQTAQLIQKDSEGSSEPVQPPHLKGNTQTVTLAPVKPNNSSLAKPSVMQLTQQQAIQSESKSLVVNDDIKTASPEATLKKALDIIYAGEAARAAQYYHTKNDIIPILQQTQKAFQETIASVTFIKTRFSDDKLEAKIIAEVRGKYSDEVKKTAFYLRQFDGEWKILEK